MAIVVGGYIVNNFSFEALFITMGTVQVIATLYLARILRQRARKTSVRLLKRSNSHALGRG